MERLNLKKLKDMQTGKQQVVQISNRLAALKKFYDSRRCIITNACQHRRVQTNQEGMKLNRTYQLMVYLDDVNSLGKNIHTINKNRHFTN